MTELIKENALSLPKNLSSASLRLFLTVHAVIVPGLVLCIAKLIDERKWYSSNTNLPKNIYSAFDTKYSLNFNNLLLQYQAGLTGISGGAL